ncbi:hypothetical protein [Bradyrhizobium sp. SZCCHNRI20481]|uniref:hypothetical protein n=1 Tax=Bradyrhizobium sp. SZCCHNRI20481 TaxID=3057286 RepID=UPI002915E264|nr:hypothetical protein [Bradyrhizobium sp. SZCCHNRI20481]
MIAVEGGIDGNWKMHGSLAAGPGRLGRKPIIANSLEELLAKIQRYAPAMLA